MKTKRLNIPLRGAREYLQGAALFDASIDTMPSQVHKPYDTFEISFHRMAHKQVDLVWDTDEAPQNTVATGKLGLVDGALSHFWICEQDEPLHDREACPEKEIFERLRFGDDFSTTYLDEKPSHSPMDTWIAMIKAMHQRRFPDAQGKWIFARAKMNAYDPQIVPSKLKVVLMATLGTKMTRNGVFLDDQLVGDVFFVLM